MACLIIAPKCRPETELFSQRQHGWVLLWWLVVALSFVLLVAASLFGFFLHLSEFLLLFGRKDGLNLRSRSLVDLLHLFSLLILSQ